MNASAVLRGCYRRLAEFGLHPDAERLGARALRAAAPGPSRLLLDAGLAAELPDRLVLGRAAAAFCNFAAFNLSDDLSDGDCTYLPPAQGPVVLLLLESLFAAALRDLELPRAVTDRVLRDLTAAQEGQVVEIATGDWDAERLAFVTDRIAGRQWSAYLTLVWAGTPLQDRADPVAADFGRLALLAGDVESADPRYVSLRPAEREVVVEQALAGGRRLQATGPAFLAGPVAECVRVLTGEGAPSGAPS